MLPMTRHLGVEALSPNDVYLVLGAVEGCESFELVGVVAEPAPRDTLPDGRISYH